MRVKHGPAHRIGPGCRVAVGHMREVYYLTHASCNFPGKYYFVITYVIALYIPYQDYLITNYTLFSY